MSKKDDDKIVMRPPLPTHKLEDLFSTPDIPEATQPAKKPKKQKTRQKQASPRRQNRSRKR